MTKAAKVEKRIEQAEGHVHHVNALIAGLAPDPREWEYRDEVCDAGTAGASCVCGHPIRYMFPVYRGADRRILGSTCVEHYAAIDPAKGARMLEALRSLEADLAARKAAARAAQTETEVAVLRAEYEALYQRAVAEYKRYQGRYVPRPLFMAFHSKARVVSPGRVPVYQKTGFYKGWYGKQIDRLRVALGEK